MKTKIKNFALPIGMGMLLSIITVFALVSTASSCKKEATKHCTNTAYPLWCSNVKVCCPAGYAHYCDGNCSSAPCGGGTVTMDNCSPE